MANHAFFTVITFNRINSFAYISFIVTLFIRPIYQIRETNLHQAEKDRHQDNLSFACLQFYERNCLNKLACNICCHKQVNNRKDSHSTPSSGAFKP